MGIPFAGYISPVRPSSAPSSSLGSPPPLLSPSDSSSRSSSYASAEEVESDINLMSSNHELDTLTENSPPSPDADLADPDSRDQVDSALEAPAPVPDNSPVAPYQFRATTLAQGGRRQRPPRGMATLRAPIAAALSPVLMSIALPNSVSPAPTSVQRTTDTIRNSARVEGSFSLGFSPEPTQSERAHDAYQAGLHPPINAPPENSPPRSVYLPPHPGFHPPFGPPVGQIRPYAYSPPNRITPPDQSIVLQHMIMDGQISGKIIYYLNRLRTQLETLQTAIGPLPYNDVHAIAHTLTSATATLNTLRRNTFSTLEDYHLIKTYNNDPNLIGYAPTQPNRAFQA